MTDSRLSPEQMAKLLAVAREHDADYTADEIEHAHDAPRWGTEHEAADLRYAASEQPWFRRALLAEIDRLSASLATARAEGRAEGLEEAAKRCDAAEAEAERRAAMFDRNGCREDGAFSREKRDAHRADADDIRALAASEAAR